MSISLGSNQREENGSKGSMTGGESWKGKVRGREAWDPSIIDRGDIH